MKIKWKRLLNVSVYQYIPLISKSVYSFIESNANQSSINHVTQSTSEPASLTSTVDLLTELSPLPDASKKRLIKRSRKTQKSEILTSFSYNNDSVVKKAKEKTLKTKKKRKFSPIRIVVKLQNVSYVEKLLRKTGSNAINAKIGLTKLALTLNHQIFIIVMFAKPKNA